MSPGHDQEVTSHLAAFGEAAGQGWTQIGELVLAFVLSSLIGLEREVRQKSAGLRTHTIVGVGAALFVLISKYGFSDVLGNGVVLDPSRVAAQIVSGIGFIGGGLIFVRRDAVRGLTTAAAVWLTAAIGSAAGAGLPVLALVATAGHFVVIYGYTPLARRLPRSRTLPSQVRLSYEDGRGVLRDVLTEISERGFAVAEVQVSRTGGESTEGTHRAKDVTSPSRRDPGLVTVVMEVVGSARVADLTAALSELPGVATVTAGDANEDTS
jgi:putative Mg2+ transporter-C (MgtC) family protein